MAKSAHRERILQQAWIGDAVLSLYARTKILNQYGKPDGQRLNLMTSNQFLSALGEASEVEAQLGSVYQQQGLEAAFAWIEATIIPLYEKQEANRLRKGKAANGRPVY
jgi:dsRNA-specific ribonuclease